MAEQQLEVDVKRLVPVPATQETLEGYGWLIGAPDTPVRSGIDFYDEVEVRQPADFRSNEDTCLNLVSFQPRDLKVRWMEFHVKHTQTFIPLSGRPFYMVLGKATTDPNNPDAAALPDLDSVKAFYFDGSGGLVMDKGTWHEVPFPIDQQTHFVCICTNETNDNLEDQGSDGECDGGDLMKRNIVKQFGYTFEITPA